MPESEEETLEADEDVIRELAEHLRPIRLRGVREDGTVLGAETDMIPRTFGGHTVAHHFVRQVGE